MLGTEVLEDDAVTVPVVALPHKFCGIGMAQEADRPQRRVIETTLPKAGIEFEDELGFALNLSGSRSKLLVPRLGTNLGRSVSSSLCLLSSLSASAAPGSRKTRGLALSPV